MVRRLDLQADYNCSALWDIDAADYPELSELPLSQGTCQKLREWQAKYDALLNLNDPYRTAFATPADQRKFEQEGIDLAQTIQAELGEEYEISYEGERLKAIAPETSATF